MGTGPNLRQRQPAAAAAATRSSRRDEPPDEDHKVGGGCTPLPQLLCKPARTACCTPALETRHSSWALHPPEHPPLVPLKATSSLASPAPPLLPSAGHPGAAGAGQAHPVNLGLLRGPEFDQGRQRGRCEESVPQAGAQAAPRQEQSAGGRRGIQGWVDGCWHLGAIGGAFSSCGWLAAPTRQPC